MSWAVSGRIVDGAASPRSAPAGVRSGQLGSGAEFPDLTSPLRIGSIRKVARRFWLTGLTSNGLIPSHYPETERVTDVRLTAPIRHCQR